MKFGVLYEHQLPRPWDGDAELAVVQQSLEQVVLADRLGVDTAWAVEHHFLEEYAHCSAPEVFLAACAARTERIRLGHGIVLMPPAYNPPARGRAAGHAGPRLPGARGLGRRRVVLASRTRGLRHRPGRPPRHVAGGRRAGRRHAGDGALSWLSGPARHASPAERRPQAGAEAPPAALAGVLEPEHDPAGGPAGRGRAHIHVHRRRRGPAVGGRLPDARPRVRADRPRGERAGRHADRSVLPSRREEARRRGLDGFRFFQFALAHYYAYGQHRPGRTDLWQQFVAVRDELGTEVLGGGTGCIGTPAEVVRTGGARSGRRRPGDLHPAERPRAPRGHLRLPGALRDGGAAAVPRAGGGGGLGAGGGPRAPRRGRARPQARRRPSPTTRSRPCRHTVCCRSTRRPSPRPTGAGWRSTGACGRSSTGPAECARAIPRHAPARSGARPPAY